jgi:hypothetical protein
VRRLAAAGVAAVVVLLVGGCSDGGSSERTSRQAEVEARGAKVMPFDQERTTHVFRSTATGGTQTVVAKRRDDARQITLVRRHLRKEARRFSEGDFADPMAIHGMTMPGIAALRRGAASVHVRYSTVPRGARIVYATRDPELVRALHAWFSAQLMDHGANAHG